MLKARHLKSLGLNWEENPGICTTACREKPILVDLDYLSELERLFIKYCCYGRDLL
jgi:hypothetical protein